MIRLAPLPLLLSLAPAARALGGVAVFEGAPGGSGSVVVYDESFGAVLAAPPELQQVRLLPIDFCGRTQLEEFRPELPRRRADVAGAARLALPRNQGCLYRFARGGAGEPWTYGFLHVARDGVARSLLERPGTGAAGQDDPFLATVAVAPDGAAFLAATRLPAGGDLLEATIASGAVVDRTAGLPPQRFSPTGLFLGEVVGVAGSARGPWRFDRTAAGDAATVSFSPDAPTFFTGDVAVSGNRLWFATTAGSAADALHVYAFDALGAARRATTAPGPLSGAGYEPVAQDGPYLAVADDGSQCAWRTEGAAREAFAARTQPLAGEQPHHLSSDQNFPDTLDEVGTLVFKPTPTGPKLQIAVGEQAAPGANAIEKVDFFEVTLSAGAAPTFTNLSLSSGDATLPFTDALPQIDPSRMTLLPDGSGLIVHDDQGSAGSVYFVPTSQSGATTLLAGVKSLDLLEVAGRHLLLGIEKGVEPKPSELWRLNWATLSPAQLVASRPEGTQFTRVATRRDGWAAFVSVAPFGGGERLERAHLGTGLLEAYAPTPSAYGPAISFTALGQIAFGETPGGGPAVFATWPFAGAGTVLQSTATQGQILPGT